MDVRVLDTDFNLVAIIDLYETLIWTERYASCGDFELHLLMDEKYLDIFRLNYYLQLDDTDRLMIIEKFDIKDGNDEADMLIISGRSLESLLERRVVWSQTTFTGTIQNAVKKLLQENVCTVDSVSPSNPLRVIPNLYFRENTDASLANYMVEMQFDGETIYEAINKLCSLYDVGYKIVCDSSYRFVFSLYQGLNRTVDQIMNPRVMFSPEFDTLSSSDYSASMAEVRTVAMVAGEGEGASRKKMSVSLFSEEPSGLDRRELFVDAHDVSSDTEDGELTQQEYDDLLIQKGMEELLKYTVTEAFSCETPQLTQYQYGVDYFNGDIVQVQNQYGIERKMRIVEVIRTQSEVGYIVYPTFVIIDE